MSTAADNRRRANDLAEGRVEVQHGTRSTYIHYLCRCDDCRMANSIYQRQADRDRHKRLVSGQVTKPHGRVGTYMNWMCRCADCTDAHNAHLRARKARP